MSPHELGSSRSSGIRSLAALMSGTVLSQGIQFSASLFITRLYTPAEFGHYASVLSVATVLATIGVLAYPTAIPLAHTDEESRVLTWLGMTLASLTAMISTVVLGGMLIGSVALLGFQPGWEHVLFVPATAMAVSIWTVLRFRQSRLGGFQRIGHSTTVGASVQVGVQLAAGTVESGSPGLSVGYLLGRLANAGLLLQGSRLGRAPRIRELVHAARAWSRMPRWLLLPSVLNVLGTSAIIPWIAVFSGIAFAGSFAFSMQMLSVPAAVLGQALATILFPRMARAERRGGLSLAELQDQVVLLFCVAVVIFVPIMIFGEALFRLCFGVQWALAGSIASVLAPWMLASLVSSPISSGPVVKGALGHVALISFAELSLRFGAIAAGGALGSPLLGVGLYSCGGVIISVNYVAWTLRLAGGGLLRLVVRNWKGLVLITVQITILLGAVIAQSMAGAVILTTILCILVSAMAVTYARNRSIILGLQ